MGDDQVGSPTNPGQRWITLLSMGEQHHPSRDTHLGSTGPKAHDTPPPHTPQATRTQSPCRPHLPTWAVGVTGAGSGRLCALPGERVPLGAESHHLSAVWAEEDESPTDPERSAGLSSVDLGNLFLAVRADGYEVFASHHGTRRRRCLGTHHSLLNSKLNSGSSSHSSTRRATRCSAPKSPICAAMTP